MYPLSYLFGLNKFKSGAWYEASKDNRIAWMLKLLDISPSDKCVDLGSGDGRIVLTMAMLGAYATGIEIDPHLVKQSKQAIAHAGLSKKAKIYQIDMWQHSCRDYTKVILYQFKSVMPQMEQKLLAELPPGARVASNYWKFPQWKISDHIEDVYLYIKE